MAKYNADIEAIGYIYRILVKLEQTTEVPKSVKKNITNQLEEIAQQVEVLEEMLNEVK